MKWLLLFNLFLLAISASAQQREKPDTVFVEKSPADIAPVKNENCLVIKNLKIINICAVSDSCFVIKGSQVFNQCAITDHCIQIKKNQIINNCKIKNECIALRGSELINTCPLDTACYQIRDSRIISKCPIDNDCLQIVGSQLINTCAVAANHCIQIVKKKLLWLTIKKWTVDTCQEGPCLREVQSKVYSSCDSCASYKDELILVYDAKIRKFYYLEPGANPHPLPLHKLYNFRLYYNYPFRFEIINLNRYLYNVNISKSDVTLASTEPLVMQQNLIAGTANGQIPATNSSVSGSSGNLGGDIFTTIQALKPNID